MQDELLHAPVQHLGDVELVFRGAGHFVYPAELLELLAGFPEYAEDLAVERQLIDAAGKRVGAVKHLPLTRRDADRPRRARSLRSFHVLGRHVADRRTRRVTVERNLDYDLAQKLAIAVEDLNATVAAIADVDISLCVGGNRVRGIEFARLIAALAPRF